MAFCPRDFTDKMPSCPTLINNKLRALRGTRKESYHKYGLSFQPFIQGTIRKVESFCGFMYSNALLVTAVR